LLRDEPRAIRLLLCDPRLLGLPRRMLTGLWLLRLGRRAVVGAALRAIGQHLVSVRQLLELLRASSLVWVGLLCALAVCLADLRSAGGRAQTEDLVVACHVAHVRVAPCDAQNAKTTQKPHKNLRRAQKKQVRAVDRVERTANCV
jgi:hypothetical protein